MRYSAFPPENTKEDMIGRVFGLLGSVYSLALPFGMIIFGPLADDISLKVLMIVSGIVLVMLGLIDKYKIDPERVEGIFERVSLLVHGICTVIATTMMDYSNEQVIKIVNDELMDAGRDG